MLAVAVMAVYVGDVPGTGSSGFALAYAANTLILVVLWFRTGLHDPAHRPASVPYSTGYLISALAFASSIRVGEPARFWFWGAALTAELAGLFVAFRRWSPPASQEGDAVIATTPSLIERMGLFVTIVLGEVVVGAVTGMAEVRELGVNAVALGLLGVLVAIGLWWLYFDLASHRAPVSRRTQLWLYLHLPLVMAIAAGGAGVLNTIEHAAEPLPDEVRWLLVGALALALVTIMLITLALEVRSRWPQIYRTVDGAMMVSALLIVAVGLTSWAAKPTLATMAALLLLPVGAGLLIFVKTTEPGVVLD